MVVGPFGLALFDPHMWGDQERVLEELARLTLAISLVGVALRLPDRWIRRKWRPLLMRSLLAVTLAMAIAILGVAKLLHGDGILAVFAAGLAVNWVIRDEEGHREARHERMQETMKRFFDVPVFIFFGMVAPFQDWLAMGWVLVLFAVVVLLFRLPTLVLLHRTVRPLDSLRDALFVGWFGPIAVAAMVYATWAEVKEGYEQLWTIGSFVIFASILVHGVTATPLTRLYARSARSVDRGPSERGARSRSVGV